MVKCSECGFLAVRNTETRELVEAEKNFRELGQIPTVGLGCPHIIHEKIPLCFLGSYDLKDEARKFAGKEDPDYVSITMVILTERECKTFTKWQLGFTPKEHKEMIDRQWLLKYEEDRRKSDRKWRVMELLAFIATGALVAFIAAWIERGSLW